MEKIDKYFQKEQEVSPVSFQNVRKVVKWIRLSYDYMESSIIDSKILLKPTGYTICSKTIQLADDTGLSTNNINLKLHIFKKLHFFIGDEPKRMKEILVIKKKPTKEGEEGIRIVDEGADGLRKDHFVLFSRLKTRIDSVQRLTKVNDIVTSEPVFFQENNATIDSSNEGYNNLLQKIIDTYQIDDFLEENKNHPICQLSHTFRV